VIRPGEILVHANPPISLSDADVRRQLLFVYAIIYETTRTVLRAVFFVLVQFWRISGTNILDPLT
jgi:hypothetical protein